MLQMRKTELGNGIKAQRKTHKEITQLLYLDRSNQFKVYSVFIPPRYVLICWTNIKKWRYVIRTAQRNITFKYIISSLFSSSPTRETAPKDI